MGKLRAATHCQVWQDSRVDNLPSVVTTDDYGGYNHNCLPRAAELSMLDMEKMLLSWQWELLLRVLSTEKPPLREAHPMLLLEAEALLPAGQ